MVIHDKIYNASKFVDEHPYVLLRASRQSFSLRPHRGSPLADWNLDIRGGEEVMMDVGGQDATEAFEDVGHSDEAREILNGLLVGKLERVVSGNCSIHRLGFVSGSLTFSVIASSPAIQLPKPRPPLVQ